MSYLRNKQARQQKILRIAGLLVMVVIIFIFRAPIGRGFSSFAHGIAWPFLKAKSSIGTGTETLGTNLRSKQSLADENRVLTQALEEATLANLERDVLFADNIALREALGRPDAPHNRIAAVILSKPNASPYDTIILDIGFTEAISPGAVVYAHGSTPIGMIDEVFGNTARAKLFSTPKETTKVIIKGGVYIDVIGKGGGSFEATLPRDIQIAEGDTLALPNLAPQVLAVVKAVISDARDPFQTILAQSPVNIQELKFVTVQK